MVGQGYSNTLWRTIPVDNSSFAANFNMETTVVIGCPYDSLGALARTLSDETSGEAEIIQVDDIGCVSNGQIFLQNGTPIPLGCIDSSYVRYPYDLIPPHTSTYVKREKTEFLKSIALLLDSVSVNDIGNSWKMRNRLLSLRTADAHGVQVPDALLSSGVLRSSVATGEEDSAVKAIGNCYVAPPDARLGEELRPFVTMAEDSGESAYIFPASCLSEEKVEEYLDAVGHTFVQEAIHPAVEYRCYCIGDSTFVYRREEASSFDRSASSYRETTYTLDQDTQNGIWSVMDSMDFQYLCFDILVTEDESEVVIDINPFGSLPPSDQLPEATEKLASVLLHPEDGFTPKMTSGDLRTEGS